MAAVPAAALPPPPPPSPLAAAPAAAPAVAAARQVTSNVFKLRDLFGLRLNVQMLRFLRQCGLLHDQLLCSCIRRACQRQRGNAPCNGNNVLMNEDRQNEIFRCQRCNCTKSFRADSFFAGTHLEYWQVLFVMYAWAYKYGTQEQVMREADIGSAHTIVDWRSFFRCTVRDYLLSHPPMTKIGGLNIIVQVDEALFARCKNHRGRVVPEMWVVGGIEYFPDGNAPHSPKSFLVVLKQDPNQPPGNVAAGLVQGLQANPNRPGVYPRSQHNLEQIVAAFVEAGSEIHTDQWAGYQGLSLLNYAAGNTIAYDHRTVNHSVEFVSNTGTHTQAVENNWMNKKSIVKTMRGVHRSLIEGYMFEWMWRDQYGEEPLENFFAAIRDQYPL